MHKSGRDTVHAKDRIGLNRGYVQVYTGNGKGKTTAAIGLTIRAIGAGLKVYIAQFMKNGDSSEYGVIKKMANNVQIDSFMTQNTADIQGKIDTSQKPFDWQSRLKEAFFSQEYDVVILEEVNMAVIYGLLTTEDLLKMIDLKPPSVELVMTGRYAHPDILDKADLVTEMKEVKHYYKAGVNARVGIER